MEKQEKKVGEMGLSIFLILFSIFVIYESYGISGSDITISSPGAFPLFISIMMLVFSIWITIENYGVSKNSNQTISRKLKAIRELVFSRDIVMTTIFLIAYALILARIGFVISTILFLWLNINFLSKNNNIKNLWIAILIVVIIVLIFNTIFNVVLP